MALSKVHEVARAEVLAPYRAKRIAKGGAVVDVWLTAAALVDGQGAAYAIATTERPVAPANP